MANQSHDTSSNGTHADDPTHAPVEDPQVGPAITYAIGVVVSTLVAIASGIIVTAIYLWASGLPTTWWILPFFPTAFGVGFEFFSIGSGKAVSVGSLGVPKLFGKRIDKVWFIGNHFVLSEGYHWLFPGAMSFIEVDHHIQTSTEIDVSGLSKDGIRMQGRIFYKYQVTRPFLYLSAKGEMASLDKIGEAKFRDAFADHDSTDLIKSETQKPVSHDVGDELKKVSGNQYGIDILEVIVPEIKLPPELEAAMSQKREREAVRDAQQVDIDKVSKWIDELKAKGIAPELAAEIVQTETGKSTSNREIKRYEGLQSAIATAGPLIIKIVDALKDKKETT